MEQLTSKMRHLDPQSPAQRSTEQQRASYSNAPSPKPHEDSIKSLFAKGDDETSRGKAVSAAEVYYSSLRQKLNIEDVSDELQEELMLFTRSVVMSAGWYQYKYLNARRWARFYIAVNVALVIGMPLAIIAFAAIAEYLGVSAIASQIAAVLTGIFALQKILSAWLSSQQNYASWYKTSFDLKCLYYGFVDKWHTRGRAAPPEMSDDLQKATTAARAIIKDERMQFYTAMALPAFDVLSILTSQRTGVTSWVSALLPTVKQANTSVEVKKRPDANNQNSDEASAESTTETDDSAEASIDNRTAQPTAEPSMQPVSYKLPAASSGLTQNVVDTCIKCGRLSNADDIDKVFDGNFIDWFNATLGSNSAFADRNHIRTDATTRDRFSTFWNQISDVFGEPAIDVLQFIALMCIALQENRGNFFANPEIVGNKLHPHLAYAFDRIGTKASYNLLSGNATALQLFNDPVYRRAHQELAGRDEVTVPRVDPAWGGSVWPPQFRTDEDESVNGFIMQADFYKLRGRGVIQTTGRPNYKALLLHLYKQRLVPNHPMLESLRALGPGTEDWTPSDNDLDQVITQSRGRNWDDLFSEADVLAAGVRVHSMRRGYLHLSTSASVLGAASPVVGSFYRVGSSINGGDYPTVVSRRMKAMTVELARLHEPGIGLPRPARVLAA